MKEKKEVKKVETNQKKSLFYYLKKNHITIKFNQKHEKSTILNQKDFEKQKKQLNLLKLENGIVLLKSATKVKDREFRTLITWMHLKNNSRIQHHLMNIKILLNNMRDYPRINRIRYLAEEKIYLRNNSPTSIINWFERSPTTWWIR